MGLHVKSVDCNIFCRAEIYWDFFAREECVLLIRIMYCFLLSLSHLFAVMFSQHSAQLAKFKFIWIAWIFFLKRMKNLWNNVFCVLSLVLKA